MEYRLYMRDAESEELSEGILVRDTMLPRVGDRYLLTITENLSNEAKYEFPEGQTYKVINVTRDLRVIGDKTSFAKGEIDNDSIEVIVEKD